VVPALAPYHLQLIVMAFGLVVTFATIANRPDSGLLAPHFILLLGFWGSIVASNVVRLRLRWGLEGFLAFGTLVTIYFLTVLNGFKLSRIKTITGLLIGCGVVVGAQAILAYHTGYLGDKLLAVSSDDPLRIFGNRVRGYGFLQDPNDFAQFLLVTLSLLGMFWKRNNIVRNAVLLGPPALIMVYAAYLTFSRGGLLGLGAVLFFTIYRKRRRAFALGWAGLGTAMLYFLRFTGGRTMVLENGRLMAWGAGVSATIHHPLFGVGFKRFEDVNDLTAHNSFILCSTELGFFGYFFWMALLVTTFMGIAALVDLDEKVKNGEDQEFFGAVYSLRAAFGCFLVTSWFLSRTYNETLYILLALAACLIHLRIKTFAPDKFQFRRWAPATVVLEFLSVVAVYVAVKARLL
jgi:hypothetical protein